MVVAEILADFLQDDSAEGLEHTAAGDRFGEVTCSSFHMVSMWVIFHNARKRGVGVLEGSSMRRIVPETQAVLRGRTNSKPSPETRVTYPSGDADMLFLARRGVDGKKQERVCRVAREKSRRSDLEAPIGPCRSLS